MSKQSHEEYMTQKAQQANDKAVQLARLQDAFLDQIRQDMLDNDLTALDELFYNILKLPDATAHLIAYLPEGAQSQFTDLIEPNLD